MFSGSGSLPRHIYCFVDGAFMGIQGWHRVIWFGLNAKPNRMWGCHVMLECGAVYRNLPPHALSFRAEAPPWIAAQAQYWDCYGPEFSLLIYRYLDGLDAWAKVDDHEILSEYLFTAVPLNDSFSHEPEQDKEFFFLKTYHGRLTVQPTNRVRFIDKSFTDQSPVPALKTQTTVYSCE